MDYSDTFPDSRSLGICPDDDYFFGVLHSKIHELWSLATGLMGHRNDLRYTPTTTFETFPFPWPPGQEPQDDPRVEAIAAAARELVELRDRWLIPPGLGQTFRICLIYRIPSPRLVKTQELKKRTLTNLYNQRPTWLDLAHRKLDQAVFAAYGWPDDLSDEQSSKGC